MNPDPIARALTSLGLRLRLQRALFWASTALVTGLALALAFGLANRLLAVAYGAGIAIFAVLFTGFLVALSAAGGLVLGAPPRRLAWLPAHRPGPPGRALDRGPVAPRRP